MASDRFLVAWPDVAFCIFDFTVQRSGFSTRSKEEIGRVIRLIILIHSSLHSRSQESLLLYSAGLRISLGEQRSSLSVSVRSWAQKVLMCQAIIGGLGI